MKYTLEVDSPVFDAIRTAVAAYSGATVNQWHQAKRTGTLTYRIQLHNDMQLLKTALDALEKAKGTASIEKAVSVAEPPSNLQVGDEMPFVYGKPRGTKKGKRR